MSNPRKPRPPKAARAAVEAIKASPPHEDGLASYVDAIPGKFLCDRVVPGEFEIRVHFRFSLAEGATQKIGKTVVRDWILLDECYYALDGEFLKRRVTVKPNYGPSPDYEGYVCCLCGADNGLHGEKRWDGNRCCECSNHTVVRRE